MFVRVVASVMYQVGTAITFNCDWEQPSIVTGSSMMTQARAHSAVGLQA